VNRAALAVLLLSAACTSTTTSAVAKLANPTAVAQVGRSMLVLDVDRAQARALALTSPPTITRAPNPIYALAIPSAPYPNAIAAYTPYVPPSESNDSPTTKDPLPFAFILSTSSSQVTVVKSSNLARLGEFQVPDTTLAIAVQPCADPANCSNEPTNLVLAVSEPTGGAALYSTSLPTDLQPADVGQIKPTRIAVDLGPKSQPQALAFSPSDRNLLAVGDLNKGDDGLGRTGSLAIVALSPDRTSGTITRYAVGGPLQELSIDPTGTRLFGLIDSAACGGAAGCFGVIGFQLRASDKTPGAPALSQVPFPGAAPLPVPANASEGAARGIAASPIDLTLSVTPASGTATDISGLVMVSLANGAVALIDGAKMAPVGVNVVLTRHVDSAGKDAALDAGAPTDLRGTPGATRTETVTIANGGTLPSLSQRSGTLESSAGTLTASGVDFPGLGVQVGDRVRFVSGCSSGASGSVAAVANGALTLASLGGCSAAGPVEVTFDVTAPPPGDNAEQDVYVVAGSVSGLMGRVHPGETFTFAGTGFLTASSGPALSFKMGSGDHGDGASYVLSLDATTMEVSLTARAEVLTMPGAIAFDPQLKFFFVAYQGGGALVEMDPTAIRASSTTSGIAVFR
jgi:hypothetical protein